MPVIFKFISPEQGRVPLPEKMDATAPRMPAMKNLEVQMQTVLAAGSESAADVAAQKRMNKAENQKLALFSGISHVERPQHKPFSLPQTRIVHVEKLTQPMIYSEESTGSVRDWESEKRPPVATSLSFPKELTESLQGSRPSISLHSGKLPQSSKK